jgi:hypothetical protein
LNFFCFLKDAQVSGETLKYIRQSGHLSQTHLAGGSFEGITYLIPL